LHQPVRGARLPNLKPVLVRLAPEEIRRLDAEAHEVGLSRQRLMRSRLLEDIPALTAAAAVAQYAGQLTAQALKESRRV
jgi:hypothetical protein